METLDLSPNINIPLTLQSMSDLHQNKRSSDKKQKERNFELQLQEYKKNIRTFVTKVQSQISQLIKKHDKQIRKLNQKITQLQKENTQLKKDKRNNYEIISYDDINNINNPQSNIQQSPRNNFKNRLSYSNDKNNINSLTKTDKIIGIKDQQGQCWSPINQRRNNSIVLPNKSDFLNIYQGQQRKQFLTQTVKQVPFKLSQISPQKSLNLNLNLNKVKNNFNINNVASTEFPIQILDPETTTPRQIRRFQRSKFQLNSNKKKMRRQQVIQYLQSGSKNLDQNTNKMLFLLGKIEPQKQQESQQIMVEQTKRDRSQELNSSLGQICDTLDNSFASRRSRAKRSGMKQKQSKQLQLKKIRQKQQQRIKKQKGVKNILKNIRDCIEYSPKKIEVVKGSKLLNAGGNQITNNTGRNSKVLINPVPVQTAGIQRKQNMECPSPVRTSGILKKNSILTKSIEGISSISIHE